MTKLIELESELRYENASGIHTYHYCECGRKSCRSNRCTICIQEEIDKLKSKILGEKE